MQPDSNTLYKLYELRRDIELASVFMAAELRTETELTVIRKALKKMEEDARRAHLSLDADLDFHLAIARATQNFFRVHMLKNIFDLAEDYMGLIVQKLLEEKSSTLSVVDQHKNIYQAIQQRDPESARRLMDDHLTWVEEKWRKFGSKKRSFSS